MKEALLVIDYINGIMQGSSKEYLATHPCVDKTNQLIDKCREQKIPIYFVKVAFSAQYDEIPKHSKLFNNAKEQGRLQFGNEGTEFSKELHFKEDDLVIVKKAVSPFCCNNELQNDLNARGIEKLIFTGISTDNAINLGVREAHDMGYYTVIAEDACGAASEEIHNATIMLLQKIANEIVLTDEVLASL